MVLFVSMISNGRIITRVIKFLSFFIWFFSFGIAQLFAQKTLKGKAPADYVNSLIGTAPPEDARYLGGNPPRGEELYYGCVSPAAMVVDPVVKLGPNTGFDGIYHVRGSSYRYTDSSIMGFTHLQHEYNQLANISFMPTEGNIQLTPGTRADPHNGYRSSKDYNSEVASAGYYSVNLKRYNINVELTATKNCGFHRYKFPPSAKANVLIDLSISQVKEPVKMSSIQILDSHTVKGWQECKTFKVYFYAVFDKPFTSFGTWADTLVKTNSSLVAGQHTGAFLQFNTQRNNTVLCKVGISYISMEDAEEKVLNELEGWQFDNVKQKAWDGWNKVLSNIETEGGTEDQKTIFYTSVYRVVAYGDFLGWPRAQTVMILARGGDWIKEQISKTSWGYGKNSFWGVGQASGVMGLYSRGFVDFPIKKAYTSLKRDATEELEEIKSYTKYGFIPAPKQYVEIPTSDGGRVPGADCVNRTLGYAYDDYCISKLADVLGEKRDKDFFYKRSMNYKNLFDPTTRFMRARNKDSSWVQPFDPAQPYAQFFYREGTAWQYLWLVPHDISGLIQLMGGNKVFERKLDDFFTIAYNPKLPLRDITGVIGQYTHGNEIDRYVPYLYNYSGSHWKTQKMVRFIMDKLYQNSPSGLCGMDDNGYLSGWYAQSALGFFPLDASDGTYNIGSPIFNRVKIKVNDSDSTYFTIEAKNASKKNVYIQSVVLNGKVWNKTTFHHSDIKAGGKLFMIMGSKPNKRWAAANQ